MSKKKVVSTDSKDKFKPAGFWIRVGAYLIDTIVVYAVALVLGFVLMVVGMIVTFGSASGALESIVPFVVFILAVSYPIWFWQSKYQATIGKMMVGIYVIKSDGSKLTTGNSVMRYIGYFISAEVFRAA